MSMTLYGYCICPIDYWVGATEYMMFFRSAEPNDALFVTDMLVAGQRLAKEELSWNGDVREGPYVMALPGDTACELVVAWKHDNNGDTFIISPVELPWLDPHYSGTTQMTEQPRPVLPRQVGWKLP